MTEPRLRIIIEANGDAAQKELGEVADELRGTEAAAKGAGQQNKQAGFSFTEMASAVSLAKQGLSLLKGGYDEIINPTVEYGRQIQDLSSFTGASVEESSRLINVFDDSKVSYDTLRVAARKLTEDGLQPNIDTIAAMSDEYLAILDPVARSQFAIEKFGNRAGPEMTKLLAQGGAAIRGMAQEAEDLGLVMDEEGVASIYRYEMAMDKFNDTALGVKIAIAENVLGPVSDQIEQSADYIQVWKNITAAVGDGRMSLLDYVATSAEVVWTDKTVADVNAELTASYQAQQAALEEVDPSVQNMRAAQADLATAVGAATTSVDTSAERWQGLADAYKTAQMAAENTTAVSNALAAGLSGTLTTAQDQYRQVLADTQPEIDALNAKLAEYYSQQGQTVTVTTEAQHSVAEYELAQLKAAAAAQTLAEYTGDNREEQLQLQIAADRARETVVSMGEEMGITQQFTLDYTEKIQDANGTLDELNAKQAEAEAQLQRTTSQFLFQQVAASLTKEAQLELANSLGLIDDESYNAAVAMQELTTKYDTNRDGTVDATEATTAYKNEVIALRDSINGMSDKTVNIDVRHTTTYQDRYLDAYREATGGGRAGGGPVLGGRTYVVGEEGPELFFPAGAGYVMNHTDSSRLVEAMEAVAAGGGRGRGDSYQIYVTGNEQAGISVAQELELRSRLRQ